MTLAMDRVAHAERPLVDVRGLKHVYGNGVGPGLMVLEDVNLKLNPNEIVGLLGRSGSGKSTLLRSIAGLITPTGGSIAVSDMAGDDTAHGVAMVFQSFALFPWLTVQKNVELGLEAQGVAADERRKRTLAAIDLIGLDGFENAYPKELSGGMRQRVGLARALVVQPSVLLMDEPFSALDVLTAETLRTDLLDLWSEGRMPIRSILLVTHNIEEAVLMCDRILVFSSNPGRVIAEIKVDLPQPRRRLDPAFRALVDDIYARMTARTTPAGREGNFPGTGLGMSLPHISTNELAGMIESLAAAPNNGSADLADLARELQLEADELLPIAETLQLMRFAEIDGRTIRLSPAARRYDAADVDERKQIFARQLLTYVPLAAHIRRVLDDRASHQAPARRFRDELEDFMSEPRADETLDAIVSWGRYAEVFAFHEDEDRFSLDDPGLTDVHAKAAAARIEISRRDHQGSVMTALQAIILAVVQGITELFPISSLGHAVLLPALLNWRVDENAEGFLPFLAVMHLGTALALLGYFWRDWVGFAGSVLRFRDPGGAPDRRLFWRVVVATIPAVVIGFIFEKKLKAGFGAPVLAAAFLVANGVMLFVAERLRGGQRRLDQLSWVQAAIIGLWQCLALIPGMSRSGATMAGGYICGLSHEDSARFSFLTATPIILGAVALEAPKLIRHHSDFSTTALLAGAVAGVTALASVWALMRWFKSHEVRGFDPFALYCALAGAGALAWLTLGR